MNLLDIYRSEGRPGLDRLAGIVGRNPGYMYLLALGHHKPAPKLVLKLVDADPRLTEHELRPDVYRKPGDAA